MPRVGGIVETALYVEDLERAGQFYEGVFGFEKLMADDRFRAYGVAGNHVLLFFKKGASTQPTVMPGGSIPPHDAGGSQHLAFSIPASDLEPWEEWLRAKEVSVESKVTCDGGGQSLYFRDPDHHLVELITPGCWAIY
jgi:catechol 2,3-dioxygenase-like lactoylglutathione lyase family enzyme